jgi:hypothetical protein
VEEAVDKPLALALHRTMVLIRRFEEKLYRHFSTRDMPGRMSSTKARRCMPYYWQRQGTQASLIVSESRSLVLRSGMSVWYNAIQKLAMRAHRVWGDH